MSASISLPYKLNETNGIRFVEQLYMLPESGEYNFDFRLMDWVEPFALLYVSYHIAIFRLDRPFSNFNAQNFSLKNAHMYAAHMGFFKSFGLDYGKDPGEASGNQHYLPITIFNVDTLEIEARENCEEIGSILEGHARRLAQVLTRECDSDLVDTIEYALREMFRNVVEHSQAKSFGFCAQYWPTKKMVEIAVLDNGIGLRSSISMNPHLDITSDKDAIYYSLLPGVSGKTYKGSKNQRRGVWNNSGFGLYMTSEICRNGGSFFVCSGQSGVMLKSLQKRVVSTHLAGTAIKMVLDTNQISDIRVRLNEFREKGQSIASQISGANISPSVASSMLSRDFI
jgi:hypothetical protein